MAIHGLAEAARSGVHALIASLGAAAAQLQIPQAVVDSEDGLGLHAPVFQAKLLTPVAVRRSVNAVEILVPADVLESVFGVQGSGAIAAAMATVGAVLVADESFVSTGIEVLAIAGGVCLYRLVLQPQGTEVA